MRETVFNYLSFVHFKELKQWDVKRFCDSNCLTFQNAIKLCDVLVPYNEFVTKEELINNNWRIISKISFSGELYLRDSSETPEFKGRLRLIRPGSLLYSKINVRHGCVYFHPKDSVPFATSSEYPAYRIDESRVDGHFLAKVLQSEHFRKMFNQISSGISKARVKPKDFLNISIPLPSLNVQRSFVKALSENILKAVSLERQATQLESDIEVFLSTELGINPIDKRLNITTDNRYNYLSFVRFKDVTEWGTDLIGTKSVCVSAIYPSMKIQDLCSVGSGGTPPRSNSQYYNGTIPWVKTGEVLNDIIYDTEEHINQEALENSSAKLYPKDSLLIAMYGQGDTRGRTAKLGINATTNQACAVLYDINNNIISTDYLWYYLQGRYDDLRSLASGNNQPNLNAGKIKNYDIVVPPLKEQGFIVQQISILKERIKQLKQNAVLLREDALNEFEKAVFE